MFTIFSKYKLQIGLGIGFLVILVLAGSLFFMNRLEFNTDTKTNLSEDSELSKAQSKDSGNVDLPEMNVDDPENKALIVTPSTQENLLVEEQSIDQDNQTDPQVSQTMVKVFLCSSVSSNDPSGFLNCNKSISLQTERKDVGTFALEYITGATTTPLIQEANLETPTIIYGSNSNCGGSNATLSIDNKLATVNFCRNISASDNQAFQRIFNSIYNTMTNFTTVDNVKIIANGQCMVMKEGGVVFEDCL